MTELWKEYVCSTGFQDIGYLISVVPDVPRACKNGLVGMSAIDCRPGLFRGKARSLRRACQEVARAFAERISMDEQNTNGSENESDSHQGSLINQRHELFCRNVAAGTSLSNAYK